MKLPVRDDRGEILKNYESDVLRIKWKTVKHFVAIIDLENLDLDNDLEIGKMVLKVIDPMEEIIKGIFPGITEEELENVDVMDLVSLAKEIFFYVTGKVEELPKN